MKNRTVIPMPGGKHILGKSNSRRVFGTAKVGDRGQIVIPKEAREHFGIHSGDTLLVLGDDKSGLIITRPEVMHDLALKILTQIDDSNDEKQEG